jgi:hypothetical protein
MVLYAIWQEVFLAHAFWQGLGAMRQYFMPYGKKYSGHMPFGKGLGQCNSTLCHMARSIPGTCLLARAPGNAIVLSAIVQSPCQLIHQVIHCFCFKKMPIRSATDTVYYSLQEEYSCLHSHAGKTSARKAPQQPATQPPPESAATS